MYLPVAKRLARGIYVTCVAFEKSTKMKKSIIITLFLFVPVFSFGQSSENQSIQSDSAKVYVSFIVETDGSVTNVKVDRVECPAEYSNQILDSSLISERNSILIHIVKMKAHLN